MHIAFLPHQNSAQSAPTIVSNRNSN